jgi:hypothetical protein
MLTKNSFYEDKISDRHTRLVINKSRNMIIDSTFKTEKTSYDHIYYHMNFSVKNKLIKKKEIVMKDKKNKIITKHRSAYRRYIMEEQVINQDE